MLCRTAEKHQTRAQTGLARAAQPACHRVLVSEHRQGLVELKPRPNEPQIQKLCRLPGLQTPAEREMASQGDTQKRVTLVVAEPCRLPGGRSRQAWVAGSRSALRRRVRSGPGCRPLALSSSVKPRPLGGAVCAEGGA